MSILILHGPNQFKVEEELQRLKKEFIERNPSGRILSFGAGDPELSEGKLKEAFWAMGLFQGDARLIILKSFLSPLGLPYHELLKELLNPHQATLVALQEMSLSGESELKAFLQGLTPRGETTFYFFDLPHGDELNQWIQTTVKKEGGKIEEKAVEKLAVFAGRDLGSRRKDKKSGKYFYEELFDLNQLHQEIKKLIGWRGEAPISEEDIIALVRPEAPQAIFDLIDALLLGNAPKAVQIVQGLSGNWERLEGETAFYITNMIANQVRALLLARRVWEQFGSPRGREKLGQLSGGLWSGGKLSLMLSKAQKIPFGQLLVFQRELFLIDQRLKSSPLPSSLILTHGLIAMAEAAKVGSRG